MTVPGERQIDELVALAGENRREAFVGRAWRLPPADLADVIVALRIAQRVPLLTALPPELAARALAYMPSLAAAPIVADLDTAAASAILDRLADDDAIRILRAVSAERRELLLNAVNRRHDLDRLLQFKPNCAGGVMTAQFPVVGEADTAGFALEALRRQAAVTRATGEIYVVDLTRRLVGSLSLAQLLMAPTDRQVREIMTDNVPCIDPASDCAEVARLISHHKAASLAVVDDTGRLLGCVRSDVAFAVLKQAAGEELLRSGGTSSRELWPRSWWVTVTGRLPRLYANLLAAFLAAAVVYFFQDSIARIVALAVWMPIVAGIGGGAATQAFTVATVRSSHGESPAFQRRAIAIEGLIGVVNGVAIGVVVAAVAVLLGESWRLGLVVFLAMAANLVVAGLAGSAAPRLFQRLGVDPAMASSTLVMTAIDVTGLALLLGLATVILL